MEGGKGPGSLILEDKKMPEGSKEASQLIQGETFAAGCEGSNRELAIEEREWNSSYYSLEAER